MRNSLILLTSLLALAAAPALARDTNAVDSLSIHGQDAFKVYSQLSAPKAFAIAADGAHGYFGGSGTAELARAEAISRCESLSTAGSCKVISFNDVTSAAASPEVTASVDDLAMEMDQGLLREAIREYGILAAPKALATSKDGAWGWSAGATDVAVARTEALRYCNRWSKSCEIVKSE